MSSSTALNIYTDGSCRHHPRRGGMGFRLLFPDHCNMNEIQQDYSPAGYKGATNNQMELKVCTVAIEEAMKHVEFNQIKRIVIHTDSLYVRNNYKRAMFQWLKTGWKKSSGAPVLNADLWKEFVKTVQKTHKIVEVEWVKGHSKNEHNKAVDKLAKKSSQNPIQKMPNVVDVRRKKTDKMVSLGSVKMSGQKVSIRIIVSEYLKTQKIHKYKYEVVSIGSKYFGCIDIVYSSLLLKAGHSYSVSFNKDMKFPQICKFFKEI